MCRSLFSTNTLIIYFFKKIAKLNKDQFLDLIKKFYNDVFIMDQNACSSPHLIVLKKTIKKDDRNILE